MTDEERIMLAVRSDQELALTERAFDGLKTAIVNDLVATEFEQNAKRERLYVALKTLGMVRQTLLDAVAAGKNARAMVDYSKLIAESGLSAN